MWGCGFFIGIELVFDCVECIFVLVYVLWFVECMCNVCIFISIDGLDYNVIKFKLLLVFS